MDWKDCDLVEVDPDVLSGVPVLKGTRMQADSVVENYDSGSPIEEIVENFDLSESMVRGVIKYANERRRPKT